MINIRHEEAAVEFENFIATRPKLDILERINQPFVPSPGVTKADMILYAWGLGVESFKKLFFTMSGFTDEEHGCPGIMEFILSDYAVKGDKETLIFLSHWGMFDRVADKKIKINCKYRRIHRHDLLYRGSCQQCTELALQQSEGRRIVKQTIKSALFGYRVAKVASWENACIDTILWLVKKHKVSAWEVGLRSWLFITEQTDAKTLSENNLVKGYIPETPNQNNPDQATRHQPNHQPVHQPIIQTTHRPTIQPTLHQPNHQPTLNLLNAEDVY